MIYLYIYLILHHRSLHPSIHRTLSYKFATDDVLYYRDVKHKRMRRNDSNKKQSLVGIRRCLMKNFLLDLEVESSLFILPQNSGVSTFNINWCAFLWTLQFIFGIPNFNNEEQAHMIKKNYKNIFFNFFIWGLIL